MGDHPPGAKVDQRVPGLFPVAELQVQIGGQGDMHLEVGEQLVSAVTEPSLGPQVRARAASLGCCCTITTSSYLPRRTGRCHLKSIRTDRFSQL